jgi:hypothetical protein
VGQTADPAVQYDQSVAHFNVNEAGCLRWPLPDRLHASFTSTLIVYHESTLLHQGITGMVWFTIFHGYGRGHPQAVHDTFNLVRQRQVQADFLGRYISCFPFQVRMPPLNSTVSDSDGDRCEFRVPLRSIPA